MKKRDLLSQFFSWMLLLGGAAMARGQTAPVITSQPASQTAVVGTSVLLSVTVSGTGPFAYQWRFNGTNISSDVITTVAGGGDGGVASLATLYRPFGVAVDSSGNLFIADANYGIVRKVGRDGIINRVAGGGANYPGDGGSALLANLFQFGVPGGTSGSNTVLGVGGPTGVAVDASGNL